MRSRREILSDLKSFQAWAGSGTRIAEISPLDFIGFVATADLFFGFAELFCPEVIERRGGLFLAAGFRDEILDAWLQRGTNLTEAQRVMNHVHISTLIQNQEISDDLAVEIAAHLAKMWALTLASYSVVTEQIGKDFADAAVTFYVRTGLPRSLE